MSDPASSTVKLLAFAAARDLLGAPEVTMSLGGSVPVVDFWGLLESRYPNLAPHRASLRLAINGTYARDEDFVRDGDEVAVIPPVSGG
jgi:molybdopterin converting factor subunit 1